jgi:transposase
MEAIPAYAVITEGKSSDISVARKLSFSPGTLLLFDRGYVALDWLAELHHNHVLFVTRLKEAMRFEVVETAPPSAAKGVLCDETGYLPGHATKGKEIFVRRVRYYDHEQQREFAFLTNHLELAPETVAALYRERWRIETFFRALKQNLRIKSFVGTSENALATQIYCALIAMLLVTFLKHRAKYGWSLSNLVALLRQQLLVYRDLWTWIDKPFEPPEALAIADAAQMRHRRTEV